MKGCCFIVNTKIGRKRNKTKDVGIKDSELGDHDVVLKFSYNVNSKTFSSSIIQDF